MSLEQIARDIREGTFPKKSEMTILEEANARLIAALKRVRPYLDGYVDDHYSEIVKQIDEALQQSTENP